MIKDFVFDLVFNNEGLAFIKTPLIKGFLEYLFILLPEIDTFSHRLIVSIEGKGVNIVNQHIYNLAHNLLAPRIQPCDGVGRDFTFATTQWVLNDELLIQMTGAPNSSCKIILRCS